MMLAAAALALPLSAAQPSKKTAKVKKQNKKEAIKKQVSKFLDFDGNEPNKAEL